MCWVAQAGRQGESTDAKPLKPSVTACDIMLWNMLGLKEGGPESRGRNATHCTPDQDTISAWTDISKQALCKRSAGVVVRLFLSGSMPAGARSPR